MRNHYDPNGKKVQGLEGKNRSIENKNVSEAQIRSHLRQIIPHKYLPVSVRDITLECELKQLV